jgi:hypothetical protein
MPVETNEDGTVPKAERDKLHALLDDAIDTYEGDAVLLETAVVHFERAGDLGGSDMPRAHVDLSASGSLDDLGTVETSLANKVVNIGLEPDEATAKENIEVST